MVALDKHGRLPLHYAARRGYYDLVWFFVTRHVDPSLVDKKGKSPLVYATEGSVSTQNLRIASVLLSGTMAKKADPNILYPNPVHQAAQKAIEAKKAKMDAKAKAKAKATSGAEGKIKAATDALAKIAEKTRPIIHAAKDNLPAFVTALLAHTAGRLACDVNAQDSLGKTALMYAVCNNDVDMVQHLFTAQEPLKINLA
ncbi:ankyrin repeat-containing protein, partial [Acanthamoeba castellanii str. Neff]